MKTTIDMAREAGIDLYGLGANHERFVGVIKAFEALVRADERDGCILELERNADKTLEDIVAAIRARGNT
jgi:hypothetical protein